MRLSDIENDLYLDDDTVVWEFDFATVHFDADEAREYAQKLIAFANVIDGGVLSDDMCEILASEEDVYLLDSGDDIAMALGDAIDDGAFDE